MRKMFNKIVASIAIMLTVLGGVGIAPSEAGTVVDSSPAVSTASARPIATASHYRHCRWTRYGRRCSRTGYRTPYRICTFLYGCIYVYGPRP